jgi:hypothetical protein
MVPTIILPTPGPLRTFSTSSLYTPTTANQPKLGPNEGVAVGGRAVATGPSVAVGTGGEVAVGIAVALGSCAGVWLGSAVAGSVAVAVGAGACAVNVAAAASITAT